MKPVAAHQIEQLVLYSPQPTSSTAFLTEHFPTLSVGETTEEFASVHFAGATDVGAATNDGLSNFWKFTVFTDDIVGLRAALVASNVDVSIPVQFGDVGFLCHLREPGGNEIELLQRTFADSPRSQPPRPDALGLITLRVNDRDAAVAFHRDVLAMSHLCEMPVDFDGRPDSFDLDFLALTSDVPPSSTLADVANREWLYQRPYTIVELQHYRSSDVVVSPASQAPVGLCEIRLSGSDLQADSPDGHRYTSAIPN